MLHKNRKEGRRPLNVIITIDTECWGHYGDVVLDIASSLRGRVPGKSGEFGIRKQLELLSAHSMHATFFVEPFFSLVAGSKELDWVVSSIQGFGSDVQLHAHPEWLHRAGENQGLSSTSDDVADYPIEEQRSILARAKELLSQVSLTEITAFRAGNYGANGDTLKALAAVDIAYDSSFNPSYGRVSDRIAGASDNQPFYVGSTLEFPVSCFSDGNRRLRHFQVTATSFEEMRHGLEEAHRLDWETFVIVLHSFEWIWRVKGKQRRHLLDRLVLSRFRKLLRYLEQEGERYKVVTFSDLKRMSPEIVESKPPIVGRSLHTAKRNLEQAWRRTTYF
ncbi:MAG: hypothetical protein AAGI88_25110 [Pseudomonadota bacterium]